MRYQYDTTLAEAAGNSLRPKALFGLVWSFMGATGWQYYHEPKWKWKLSNYQIALVAKRQFVIFDGTTSLFIFIY